jgi:hypothetical protein
MARPFEFLPAILGRRKLRDTGAGIAGTSGCKLGTLWKKRMCASDSSATQLRDLALGLRGCGGGEGTLAAASAARPAAPDAQRDIAATDGSEPSPVPRPPAKQHVSVTLVPTS